MTVKNRISPSNCEAHKPQSDSDRPLPEEPILLRSIVEGFTDGILMLTDQGKLVYTNDRANRICRQLQKGGSQKPPIPAEVWHICQYIIESKRQFPQQNWMTESQIFTRDEIALRIRVRWLLLEQHQFSHLLVTLEDLYQPMENIAIAEAEKYGLTRREQEVWLLHKSNYTYKEIAAELHITPNTVKKHMKSIYCKRRSFLKID